MKAQEDLSKAQNNLAKAQAELVKADVELVKTNATLNKDIEAEQERLHAKIQGFRKVRKQAKIEKRRVKALKSERDADAKAIYEYVSTGMNDESAAKRMEKE